MSEQKGGVIKRCKTCCYLDEYFGDCCHPEGGGASNIQPSMHNCLESHNWAWWKGKRDSVKDFIENIDDKIDLNEEDD